MISKETADYLFSLLYDGDDKAINLFAYCKENEIDNFNNKKIIIIQSAFFDDEVFGSIKSMPILPLKRWHDIPILFGSEKEIQKDRQTIIYADLIASTFFMISRYEETLGIQGKDKYGRVKGTDSLPYRGGFIDRPIIDEYRFEINKTLGYYNTPKGFRSV